MAKKTAAAAPNPKDDPTAMRPARVAELLSKAGGRLITAEQLRRDIEAGMPTNGDGTLNLMHVTAWLAREAE